MFDFRKRHEELRSMAHKPAEFAKIFQEHQQEVLAVFGDYRTLGMLIQQYAELENKTSQEWLQLSTEDRANVVERLEELADQIEEIVERLKKEGKLLK